MLELAIPVVIPHCVSGSVKNKMTVILHAPEDAKNGPGFRLETVEDPPLACFNGLTETYNAVAN